MQIRGQDTRHTQYPQPHREIHLKDLVGVVSRHWLLVVVLVALVGGGAYLSGRRTIPQYQSNLTVQINSPKQVFARLDDIDVDELALRTDPILSEALFLTTQELALRVVSALNLQLQVGDPQIFRGTLLSSVAIDTSTLVPAAYQLVLRGEGGGGYELQDRLGQTIAAGSYDEPAYGPGFSFVVLRPADEVLRTPDAGGSTTNPRVIPFQLVTPEHAASWVTGGISYRVRPNTNAVDISYTGTDPTLVPLILNQAAVELRADGARRARVVAGQRRRYVQLQTQAADSNYQSKLHELQSFKEHQQITDLSSEERAVVTSIQEFEHQRRTLLVQIATIRDAMAKDDSIGIETLNRLGAHEGIAKNAALSFQIRTLLERYDERRSLTAGAMGLRTSNPRVSAIDEQIVDAHAALRAAVDATLRGLQARLDALAQKIDEQRATLATFPGKETRIAQLELEATIINETYRYLLGQYEAARLQEATIAPYIDILDGASPAFRVGTTVPQKVILGVLVGLLFGLGGAFFLEYVDQTIKSSADLERVLGVPVLGLIPLDPKLRSANGKRALITVDRLDVDDPAAESYRSLRTNVTFVGAEKPVQLVAITSPGPQEGKSTTAMNLAVTLAQSGRRTLLIDADLRRPQLHRAFGVIHEPGLTDVLVGQISNREAIRPDVVAQLDFLPSGPPPPNPSELLGSDPMQALIRELRRGYEYIVVDTPPTLPVTDAAVLATHADATILVVRSGDTEEGAAQRALEQLRRVRARVGGAVLNAVSSKRDRQYTYYSYRRPAPSRSRLSGIDSKIANSV